MHIYNEKIPWIGESQIAGMKLFSYSILTNKKIEMSYKMHVWN